MTAFMLFIKAGLLASQRGPEPHHLPPLLRPSMCACLCVCAQILRLHWRQRLCARYSAHTAWDDAKLANYLDLRRSLDGKAAYCKNKKLYCFPILKEWLWSVSGWVISTFLSHQHRLLARHLQGHSLMFQPIVKKNKRKRHRFPGIADRRVSR